MCREPRALHMVVPGKANSSRVPAANQRDDLNEKDEKGEIYGVFFGWPNALLSPK